MQREIGRGKGKEREMEREIWDPKGEEWLTGVGGKEEREEREKERVKERAKDLVKRELGREEETREEEEEDALDREEREFLSVIKREKREMYGREGEAEEERERAIEKGREGRRGGEMDVWGSQISKDVSPPSSFAVEREEYSTIGTTLGPKSLEGHISPSVWNEHDAGDFCLFTDDYFQANPQNVTTTSERDTFSKEEIVIVEDNVGAKMRGEGETGREVEKEVERERGEGEGGEEEESPELEDENRG